MKTSFVHLPGYLLRFIVESNGTKYASPSGNAIHNPQIREKFKAMTFYDLI